MIRLLAALLLAASLAACTALPAVTAGCRLETAATLPLLIRGGHANVPARLDGHGVLLVIDTGAQRSLITPAAAQALGLPRNPRQRTTIHGVGGTFTSNNALVRHFEVGGIDAADQSLPVGPIPNAAGAAGILGAEWLNDFDVDLDIPHRRMTLIRAQGCAEGFDPVAASHFAVPFRRTPAGLILLPIAVNGATLHALLDTGAENTSMTADAAARTGATAEILALDKADIGVGVDLRRVPRRLHVFAEIGLGPARYRDIVVRVSDVEFHGADMLLGLDFLTTHRLWISNATNHLFITAEPPR